MHSSRATKINVAKWSFVTFDIKTQTLLLDAFFPGKSKQCVRGLRRGGAELAYQSRAAKGGKIIVTQKKISFCHSSNKSPLKVLCSNESPLKVLWVRHEGKLLQRPHYLVFKM